MLFGVNIKVQETYGIVHHAPVSMHIFFIAVYFGFMHSIHYFIMDFDIFIHIYYLWTLKGCFVETCHPDEIPTGSNITDICPINNGIINLQNKTENLNKCLEQSDQNRGDVCKDCLQSFNDVSNHFDQLHSAPNGICFEAVDQVNSKKKI